MTRRSEDVFMARVNFYVGLVLGLVMGAVATCAVLV